MSDNIRWESRGLTLRPARQHAHTYERWDDGRGASVQHWTGEGVWRAQLLLDSGLAEGRGNTLADALETCDRDAEERARSLVREWAPWLVLP